MPKHSKTQAELLRNNWEWESADDGRWDWESLRTAAACETARQAIIQSERLQTLISLLNSLGADGLHTVIRHHYRKATATDERTARRKRQLAKARRKAKR